MNLFTRIAFVAVSGTALAAGWTLLEDKTTVLIDGEPVKRDNKIILGVATLTAGALVGMAAVFSE
jgi:uncharacterized spore protein YtfJ